MAGGWGMSLDQMLQNYFYCVNGLSKKKSLSVVLRSQLSAWMGFSFVIPQACPGTERKVVKGCQNILCNCYRVSFSCIVSS